LRRVHPAAGILVGTGDPGLGLAGLVEALGGEVPRGDGLVDLGTELVKGEALRGDLPTPGQQHRADRAGLALRDEAPPVDEAGRRGEGEDRLSGTPGLHGLGGRGGQLATIEQASEGGATVLGPVDTGEEGAASGGGRLQREQGEAALTRRGDAARSLGGVGHQDRVERRTERQRQGSFQLLRYVEVLGQGPQGPARVDHPPRGVVHAVVGGLQGDQRVQPRAGGGQGALGLGHGAIAEIQRLAGLHHVAMGGVPVPPGLPLGLPSGRQGLAAGDRPLLAGGLGLARLEHGGFELLDAGSDLALAGVDLGGAAVQVGLALLR